MSAEESIAGRLSRSLRQVTGVDERLLDEVPSERARYTRLGGVIVGTASIAALSMWFALGAIVDDHSVAIVAPALLWGIFIANLDAWLVSGLHGTHWRRHKLGVIVPRLLLALFFGFLIAEPIVLKAFEPAIEREISDSRQAELRTLRTLLGRCNPTSGPLARAVPACSTAVLVVGETTPDAIAAEVQRLKQQVADLQRSIDSDAATQRRLDATARKECNGTSGAGLSGDFGVGVNCVQNRADAADFRASSPRRQEIAQKVRLTRRISALTSDQRQNASSYDLAVRAAIAREVDAARAAQREIGLLERLDALRTLVAGNVSLKAAEWLLRLLFVTIDCLPLLAKISSGPGAYDFMLDKRLAATERTFDARERHLERTATASLELELYRLERTLEAEKEKLDSELRLDQARREIEVDRAIDEFTEQMLRAEDREAV